LEFLGEHEGLGKYHDKYDTKNLNEVRHFLATHSNSASQFGLGLRNYPLINRFEKSKTIEKDL
jgi:hypothetical protein